MLANRLPSPLDPGNKGDELELFNVREGRSPFLSTATDGKLLAQKQDFKVFLMERLLNDMQHAEQKGPESVK